MVVSLISLYYIFVFITTVTEFVAEEHRIKIEIVTDTDDPKLQAAPTPAPAPPTLLQRIGHAPATAQNGTKVVPLRVGPPVAPTPT